MKAIITDKAGWQELEDKVYQALVAAKVIKPYVNEEKEEVLPLNYSSLRQNPKTAEYAFEVKKEAEAYLTKDELAEVVELDWTWFCGRNSIKGHPNTVYWIAYSDNSNVISGETGVGQTTTSGQQHLECFNTAVERDARIAELKAKD